MRYPRDLTIAEIAERFPNLIELQALLVARGLYAEINVRELGANDLKANISIDGPPDEVEAVIAELNRLPPGGFTVGRL